jgi:parallel beta-helix repeat protein
LALAGSAMVVLAPAAGAATVTVQPGQSIQAAVDAAAPGTTIKLAPGVYHDNVEISKKAITIQGSGAGNTVLEPPAAPHPGSRCVVPEDPEAVNGICVAAFPLPENGSPTALVTAPHITGLTVRNFSSGIGVLFFGVKGGTVDHVVAANDGAYGITAFASTGTRFMSNVTFSSKEAGLYVGDSPNAAATVQNNVSFDNQFGIFIRSASKGTINNNNVYGNCAGILFLNQPNSPTGWVTGSNAVHDNDRACPPSREGPPLSGAGILLFGAGRNTIQNNTVNDNAPGGPTAVSGGIVLVEGSSGNNITNNNAHRNVPVDLADDSGAANRFAGNRCDTSRPPGLCRAH